MAIVQATSASSYKKLAENNSTDVIKYYNTVDDMKRGTGLKVGDVVKTLGYYEIGDGGGAEYEIVSSKDTSRQDIEYILLDNKLYSEFLIMDNIKTSQFGIKGDGVSNTTLALNSFFEIETNFNKELSNGTFLISDTVFVKGKWREDSPTKNNNQLRQYIFNGNLLYKSSTFKPSVIFYNMFKAEISGFSINRTSDDNIVDFIGCWHCNINNFDVGKIGLQYTTDSFEKETATTAVHTLNYNNGYVLKGVYISTGDSYTNSINFNDVTMAVNDSDYVVHLLKNNWKQNINFNRCDMSYAKISIFNVPEKQVSVNEGAGINDLSNCTVSLFECYFDSDISFFEDEDEKNITFSAERCFLAAYSKNQNFGYSIETIEKNNISNNNGYSLSTRPISNTNLAYNGDLSVADFYLTDDRLLGPSNSQITKTFIKSKNNINNNALRLEFVSSDRITQYVTALEAPTNSVYNAAIRMKIVSGECDILVGQGGSYFNHTKDKLPVGKNILIPICKNVLIDEGGSISPNVTFQNIEGNLVIEIYEISVFAGREYQPFMNLHELAKISEKNIVFLSKAGGIPNEDNTDLIFNIMRDVTNESLFIDMPITLGYVGVSRDFTMDFLGNKVNVIGDVRDLVFRVSDGAKFTLKNAIFDGNEENSTSIIQVKSGCTLLMSNCEIRNLVEMNSEYITRPIYLFNGSNSTIENCKFYNIKQVGNNVITDGPGSGSCIQSNIEYSTTNEKETVINIDGCHFENCFSINSSKEIVMEDFDAIKLQNGKDVYNVLANISNCSFINISKRAIKIQTNNVNISNITHHNDETITENLCSTSLFYNNHNINNYVCNFEILCRGFEILESENINISNVNFKCADSGSIKTEFIIIDRSKNINIENINSEGTRTALEVFTLGENIKITNSNFKNSKGAIELSTRNSEGTTIESGILINNIVFDNCSFEVDVNLQAPVLAFTKTAQNIFKNISLTNSNFILKESIYQYDIIRIFGVENIKLDNNVFDIAIFEDATEGIYLKDSIADFSNNIFNFSKDNSIIIASSELATNKDTMESSTLYVANSDTTSRVTNFDSKIKGTSGLNETNYKEVAFKTPIIKVFNTVADMKASTTLEVGDAVQTLGMNTKGDLGSAKYEIITSSENIEDNYFNIALGNNLFAKLIDEGTKELRPSLFNATKQHDQVQGVINLACSRIYSGGVSASIFLDKLYQIDSGGLQINKKVNNRGVLTLFSNGDGGLAMYDDGYLLIKQTEEAYVSDIKFLNMSFYGTNDKHTKLFKSPDFINVFIEGCNFHSWSTITDSTTYAQNINLTDSVITGGKNNLFDLVGCYGVYINNTTIEVRTDCFVFNQLKDETVEDSFITELNIDNCLIEGFYGASGLVNLYKVESANIQNNYFEVLPSYINIYDYLNSGIINISNNRFWHSPETSTLGAINLINGTGESFNCPRINFSNNFIRSMFAIHFGFEKMIYFAKKIKFEGNSVNNNLSSTYLFNSGANKTTPPSQNTNIPFNIIPVVSVENSETIYYNRENVVIESSDSIIWNKAVTINGQLYDLTYELLNNVITIVSTAIFSTVNSGNSSLYVFFGVDMFSDDIFSVQLFSELITLKNAFRSGDVNQKKLNLIISSESEIQDLTVRAKLCLTGDKG